MDVFAQRRQRVLDQFNREAMGGRNKAVAVLPSAPVTIRNNDVEHEYRQDSDLYYLTGFDEPDSALILTTAHDEHRSVLFVRPRDPEREVWDGARAGVDGAKERCGVDAAFPIAELGKRLPEYLSGADRLYYELGKNRRLDERMLCAVSAARGKGRSPKSWPRAIEHPESLWHEMRLIKDEEELGHMRRAAAITAEAHRVAMAAARPGTREFEIDALLREVFLRRGAERPAYTPIVGSGPNATVLHYRAGKRTLEDGDLLLVDAGCEYDYYAADVTRTYPVSGRFSEPQRQVYEAVLEAQLAGVAAATPGSTIEEVHRVTRLALVQGMVRIGLLQGDRDELIDNGGYKRFFMHRTSHWLGMDVHDVGAYFVDGIARPLKPGMVLTIEPGIYVSPDDAEAPERFRGIGVRIEDDIVITVSGHENLSADVPKSVEAVEKACAA